MKIGAYRSTSPSRPVARSHPGSAASAARAPEPPREIMDTAEILGVPQNELTPKVRSAMMSLMAEVETLQQELADSKRRVGELEKIADQDPLVPVANRRAFVREMSRMISYAERYKVPTSLVFFDINGMKTINDTHGHQAGDKALMQVADTLLRHTRDTDVIGRLGGDEFAVILPQVSETAAMAKADDLATAIKGAPFEIDGETVEVEVAYGIFPFRAGEDATSTLAAADKRMYERKRRMKEADADAA